MAQGRGMQGRAPATGADHEKDAGGGLAQPVGGDHITQFLVHEIAADGHGQLF